MAAVYAPSQKERELIQEIQKKYTAAHEKHRQFENNYERHERAYRGLIERASSAAKWKHRAHPPYGFNLIETVVSNLVEQGLRMDVRPSPFVNMTPEDAKQQLAMAQSMERLLQHEWRVDKMDTKQRPLFLTASIGGRGVGKTGWNYVERAVKRQGVKVKEVTDPNGNIIARIPQVVDMVENGAYRDHSTFEVVDPRDFIVHEGARQLQPFEPGGAQYVFHRQWYSYEQLLMLQAGGFLKNVEFIEGDENKSDEPSTRSQEVMVNKAKDQIEAHEYWCMMNGEVYRTIVSASGVILRDASSMGGEAGDQELSPFWHGEYPFIICSSMPQPFDTYGVGDMELIEQIQELLWEFLNQRLDNLELLNNYITIIREDVFDPDAFQFFPGARWLTPNGAQDVETLTPPYQVGEISIHAEALLRGDLQNVTSSAPFAGGTETATVDQTTATGASIVMNAAQARMQAKKWTAMQGIVDEANQRLANCKQFIDTPKLVHIIGPDGEQAFQEISPLEIQGEWLVQLNPESDSNMRQERRSEAMQFFQALSQAAPLFAASGTPLNLSEVLKWAAEKWDIVDVDRFLSQQPESMGAQQAGAPGGGSPSPAGPGGPPTPNLGVTAPAGPGADMAGSPIQALQRALAMGGGANNAPGIPGR